MKELFFNGGCMTGVAGNCFWLSPFFHSASEAH